MNLSTTQEYVRSDALLVSLSEHVPCHLRVNNVGPFFSLPVELARAHDVHRESQCSSETLE